MIANDALVVSSVVGQVCQRCRQIPRADCLDARGLHDVLRKCIVQQQYGVCPPVRILPVHIRTKREGVGCHLRMGVGVRQQPEPNDEISTSMARRRHTEHCLASTCF